MSIWTRPELIDLISRWKEAYKAVSCGKSYTLDGRSLTYQDVATIRGQLDFLQGELEALDGKSGSLKYVNCRTVR